MLRSVGKQSRESVQSVSRDEEITEGYGRKDLQKKERF